MQHHSHLAALGQQHFSLGKWGFCGLVLQWGTSKLWSPAWEALAHSRAAGLTALRCCWTPWPQGCMKGQCLYHPPQPKASTHPLLRTQNLPSSCPSSLARPPPQQGLEGKRYVLTEKSPAWKGNCIPLLGGEDCDRGGARQGPTILLQTLSLWCTDPWRALAVLLPAGRSQLRAIRVEAEKAPLSLPPERPLGALARLHSVRLLEFSPYCPWKRCSGAVCSEH